VSSGSSATNKTAALCALFKVLRVIEEDGGVELFNAFVRGLFAELSDCHALSAINTTTGRRASWLPGAAWSGAGQAIGGSPVVQKPNKVVPVADETRSAAPATSEA
jgi:hypothetical protein